MDINDKIFDFAYSMAFRDATMRNAFPMFDSEKKRENGTNVFRDRKRKIKDYSKGIVRDYIDEILADKEPDPLNTIKKLCNGENKKQGFSFGNAQKLVNMTAKYMFLSAYGDSQQRKKFKNCHCPMDGVMMERLKDNCEEYKLEWEGFKKSWSQKFRCLSL